MRTALDVTILAADLAPVLPVPGWAWVAVSLWILANAAVFKAFRVGGPG